MMATKREEEVIQQSVIRVSGVTTIVISLITWFMFAGWLLSKEQGGLGSRNPNTVTAEYFNWHPFLMTASFFLFMVPAMLSFEIYPFSRSCNKKWHGILNTLSIICVIAGLFIILDCHLNLSDKGLFNSIHAVCGYMSFSVLCLQYIAGASLYGLGCFSDELKKMAMPYHKRFGTFALLSGCATIIAGLAQTINPNQLKLGQLMTGFVFLVMLGVIFSLTKYVNKRDEKDEYIPTENEDPDDQTDDDQMVVQT